MTVIVWNDWNDARQDPGIIPKNRQIVVEQDILSGSVERALKIALNLQMNSFRWITFIETIQSGDSPARETMKLRWGGNLNFKSDSNSVENNWLLSSESLIWGCQMTEMYVLLEYKFNYNSYVVHHKSLLSVETKWLLSRWIFPPW